MKQDKKLIIGMTIFTFCTILAFAMIIINEKKSIYIMPQIEKKLKTYIQKNYQNIITEIKTTPLEYKDDYYTMKAYSKDNKNYYFLIKYHNKKITDTFQKDYIEGKSFLTYISKSIEENIRKKTKKTSNVSIPNTLDKFTTKAKSNLMTEKNPESLKIYTLELEIVLPEWTKQEMIKKIKEEIEYIEKKQITPKNYTIILESKEEITKAVKIKNLEKDFINNPSFDTIITDIINNKQSNILKDNNISYQYLN